MPPIPSDARARDSPLDRLVRGAGRYVADRIAAGDLHAAFVRSDHPHARLVSCDLADARGRPGVVAVFDGDSLGPLHTATPNPLLPIDGTVRAPLLARGVATWVGQPLAVVVAREPSIAREAAARIAIDVAPLPARRDPTDRAAATVGQAPAVRIAHRGGDATAAGAATQRVSVVHRQPRVVAMAMEPRCARARWDARAGTLDVEVGTQSPSRARADVAHVLGLTPDRVRVIAPDVGGAFGAKSSLGPEELVVAWLAHRLEAAVVWVASRGDEFASGAHGRGARLEGTLALDEDGGFVGLEARLAFPLGAWMPYSAVVPLRNTARILPGPYRVASVDIDGSADVAHAAPVTIYRGAGRPEAALLMETLVERAARCLRVDPVELRRHNLVAPRDLPWRLPGGDTLDSGDHAALLERACDAFDYAAQRRAQTRRRAAGELVGIGLALYVEPCGQGWESARVVLQADGRVRVESGSSSQGQGHATSYAQIAAEALGCTPSAVEVVEGDTARCPAGIGALASRGIAIGGSAVLLAAREAAARRDAGEALPLAVERVYTAPAEAWASGCVIARMAIDAETGTPRIERIVWADDAGRIVSPALARGQLLGGLAQGVGQAMMERVVYDDEGQLLTGTLMDYAVPRAGDIPPVELVSLHTPTAANALGAKGVGEAGCIGVPAALLNAAADALAPSFGERELDFPLTAERLWRAMRDDAATPRTSHGDVA